MFSVRGMIPAIYVEFVHRHPNSLCLDFYCQCQAESPNAESSGAEAACGARETNRCGLMLVVDNVLCAGDDTSYLCGVCSSSS